MRLVKELQKRIAPADVCLGGDEMQENSKGIIYVMSSAVPGLIKIGKTGVANYEQRMYNLEHNGYRNVTALKRVFAIEVESYDEKEKLLHTIFEKSRVSDTEMFALDVNIAIKLLSSFEGKVIFPKTETKEEVFEEAVESSQSKSIPNGIYHFQKKKKSDNKTVKASAKILNGKWTLLKGSILGMTEDKGTTKKSRATRELLSLDESGKLLEDFELGECTPSFAGDVVMNQSINGWDDWYKPVDIYRKNNEQETDE